MNKMLSRFSRFLAASPLLLAAATGSALAAGDPVGTWIDHTGRGAVEISPCNGALCGRIVWLKAAADQEACGMQIIGNARPASGGKWDGGWIYDPDARAKYDVELTPLGDGKLKVLGYAGTKMFGETMTWTRAPADLKRCNQVAPEPHAPESHAPESHASVPRGEPGPSAPPSAASPERGMDPETRDSPARQARGATKQCGIKFDGLGELTFPCPQ
jgi:uncharacterized protein (DUF2147 family)